MYAFTERAGSMDTLSFRVILEEISPPAQGEYYVREPGWYDAPHSADYSQHTPGGET